jgi:hypothetical protein
VSIARQLVVSGALLALIWGRPQPAAAGCGCDKPPPPPAAVRPTVAYAGAPISLFSAAFRVGQVYDITFAVGLTGQSATISGTVVNLRDLADGIYKPQLVVTLPTLPLGPASITVRPAGQATVAISVPDSAFTVAPMPVAVPNQYGAWHFPNYRAAVGRDGTVYIALDLTDVELPEVVEAQAAGYPLRFGGQSVVFKNVQGFLMQLITNTSGQPVPGMFVFPASNPTSDSDVLHYSRHEFVTYYLQHLERQPHALDLTDGNWHVDGSRHVDHDHLILAISGTVNGVAPAAGATPAFDLVTSMYSLFYQGLTGASSITMSGSTYTNSYDRNTGAIGADGAVFTNGQVSMSNTATVNGDATAAKFNLSGRSMVTGSMSQLGSPVTFMQIKVPPMLPSLGTINLKSTSMTIVGPGSFQASSVAVKSGGVLFIDNSQGPVTLYVLGVFKVTGGGIVQVADPNPEHFAVYAPTTKQVTLTGGGSAFYGVVYAPNAPVSITGSGDFSGAFVGGSLSLSGTSRVHYDSNLRGN